MSPLPTNRTTANTPAEHVADHNTLHAEYNTPTHTHSGTSVVIAQARRTSGDITLNSTNWANVDTGLDLTLAAVAGDVIEVGLSALCSGEAVTAMFDAVTIVSAAPVNSLSANGAPNNTYEGVVAWYCVGSSAAKSAGSIPYVVQAGDVSGGNVVLRLRYRTSTATNRNLNATADQVLHFWAKNYG